MITGCGGSSGRGWGLKIGLVILISGGKSLNVGISSYVTSSLSSYGFLWSSNTDVFGSLRPLFSPMFSVMSLAIAFIMSSGTCLIEHSLVFLFVFKIVTNLETISTLLDKLNQFPLKHCYKKRAWYIIYHPCESSNTGLPISSPWTVCRILFDVHGIRIKTGKGDEYAGNLTDLADKVGKLVKAQLPKEG